MNIIKKLDDNFSQRQASYKMVTVLSLLEACDNKGAASIDKVAEHFLAFYLKRHQRGKVVEKEDKKLAHIAQLSPSQVKEILLQNPVKHLKENELIGFDQANNQIKFSMELVDVSNSQTQKELRRVAYKHLYNYYREIGGLQLLLEDFKDLPPEYPVTADDVASLSGQNRVKGIHPIKQDDFQAVVILCTLGGDNYPNQWLDNGKKLKYFAEARTSPDGSKQYNLEMQSNKAIINSKEEGAPLYVFVREKKGELFHFAGEFAFVDTGEEDTGDVYFILEEENGGTKRVTLPDISSEEIIDAMKEFDQKYRNSGPWRDWEKRPQQKYAIEYEDNYYPPKMIIALATGIPREQFSGGDQTNNYLESKGFKIITLTEAEEQPNNLEMVREVDDPVVKSIVEAIERNIEGKGFHFEPEFVRNLYLSLKTKPLVILAGISGTGKSKLVELFANALGATRQNQRFELVPVRPDWNDSTDLLGYLNLQNQFVPGPLTEVLERALADPVHPYFVCLDEMNLARVEYYFSDFLSIIESRHWEGDALQSAPIKLRGYHGEGNLYFPSNLYVMGTVNMDETTHSFSRKVLDRANTIELSEVNLSKLPSLEPDPPATNEVANSFLMSEYLTMKDCINGNQEYFRGVIEVLEEINSTLERVGLHVGYRVRDEISFYMLYNQRFNLLEENQCLDLQLLQKILPRIQGSSFELEKVLESIKEICGQKYELSRRKAEFMLERYAQDGFTSFWL